MSKTSQGIPAYPATMTFTLPDSSIVEFPVEWTPCGTLFYQLSAAEFQSKVGARMEALGEELVSARVTLNEDPSVLAEIDLNPKWGLVPVGDALAQWARKMHPEDCAYLDEVLYPATLLWRMPDGGLLRMPAQWVNTGEVRPRPKNRLLSELMKARWALEPGATGFAHIILRADPTIVAAVKISEDNEVMAPSLAFETWVSKNPKPD